MLEPWMVTTMDAQARWQEKSSTASARRSSFHRKKWCSLEPNVIFQLGLSSNTCHNVSTQLRKNTAKTTDQYQDFISRNCPMKSAQTCHIKSRGQVTPRHSFLELRESASSSQTSLESVPVMHYVSFLGSQIKAVHASFWWTPGLMWFVPQLTKYQMYMYSVPQIVWSHQMYKELFYLTFGRSILRCWPIFKR